MGDRRPHEGAQSAIDIDGLARDLVEIFPTLDPEPRRVSLALYRLLAEGQPVSMARLAAAVELDEDCVSRIVDAWPGVYRDDAGSVIGYWGLAIPKMDHGFEVDGRGLFTWCAWDTLFIPEILGKEARVESRCPVTGKAIRLVVGPHGVVSLSPEGAVVSFPDTDAFDSADVISSFCHYIYFFESREAGRNWAAEHEGTILLTVAEADRLGRRKNALQYGDGLR